MDLYCPRCGEAYGIDELHGQAKLDNERFADVFEAFKVDGCVVLGVVNCVPHINDRSTVAQAAYELCGDDVDGAASDMDDMLYLLGG